MTTKEFRRLNEQADRAEYGHRVIKNERSGSDEPIKVYLAIPYTFNAELSFKIANKVAADLMQKGYIVFSPISHSHLIADHLPKELRYDQAFWMKQDLPMISWCDEVHVVCIGEFGHNYICESKGCMRELKEAKEKFKPVKVIEWYE